MLEKIFEVNNGVLIKYSEPHNISSIYTKVFIDLIDSLNLAEYHVKLVKYIVDREVDKIICPEVTDRFSENKIKLTINRYANHNVFTPNVCSEILNNTVALKVLPDISRVNIPDLELKLLLKSKISDYYKSNKDNIVRIFHNNGAYSVNDDIINMYLSRSIYNTASLVLLQDKFSDYQNKFNCSIRELVRHIEEGDV